MKNLFYFLLPFAAILFSKDGNDVRLKSGNIYSLFSFKVSDAAPAFELSDLQPIDKSGNVVFLSSAANSTGEKTTGLLSVYFKIKNKEGKPVKLQKIQYTIGNKIILFTGTTLSENISNAKDITNNTVAINESLVWQNSRDYHELGSVIKLENPFPTSISIKIFFDGYSTPYTITKNLKAYLNDIPGNGFDFPGKEKDLRYEEYWNGAATHGGGAQVFAYDLGVKGWDHEGKKWSSLLPKTDGSKNEHYRCYGKPVYAMADGEVVSFKNILLENPSPGKKLQEVIDIDYGGNNFVINHGSEQIKYSHFQKNSLNSKLMKVGARVAKGDFLGLLGNSGNSSNPHLHIDKRSPFGPIQFKNMYVLDEKKISEPDPGGAWVKADKKGIPYERCMIWPSASKPCWYARGWSEIGRHGISENDYQSEFNRAWGCGYYPEWVDAYDVNGKTYFNAIFRYNSNGYKVVARHDMSTSKYQDEYNLWVKKNGYRLQQIDNYNDNGKLKIAAIFIKRAGQPNQQPAYHGVSPEAHQKMFEDYGKQGFVPVNVSVTSVSGKRYYSAFYEKRNVGQAVLKSFLTQQEYQDLFDDMKKKNYEQVYVNAYHHDGKTRFTAIWYQHAGYKSYSATRKSSSSGYQEKYEDNVGKSLLTQCVTGYEEDNKHWYAALWAK